MSIKWQNEYELINEFVVKPKKGTKTRVFNYVEITADGPDMQPTEVTKKKGDLLRISTSHKLGMDIANNIRGADERLYRSITDDPANGEAVNLYVKTSDIEIVRSGAAYTVLNQDNLTKIAEKIYGSANNGEVEAIYQANKRIIGNDKNLIHPGQKLLIPYPLA
jgi:nucleoid-associated protein YgaU